MKKAIIFVAVMVSCYCSIGCTTFLLQKDGTYVFGRNYDWITGAGIVYTNQRGLYKTAFVKNDKPISWVSLNGSITFNQYGKEFPTGGMNEHGLVVELMWLDEAKYPSPDDRPAINVLQWIQYQLDMHATVADVSASNNILRISAKATPLHFLVADAKGNAATIEFLNGEMVVHRGDQLPFPVLTNDTYKRSADAVKSARANRTPPGNNSLERFVTACNMINGYESTKSTLPILDYAFFILDKVAQGSFTKWSIVYDISHKKVYFKTADFTTIKSFSFNAFDFSCTASSKMFDMNQAGEGNIAADFILPDKQVKLAALEKAVKESQQYVTISDAEKQSLLNYEYSVHCKK